MASVSGMSPLHNSQSHEIDEDHRRQPNRYCRTLCHGTCESPRLLLRIFHTNSNLPSAQGPLQHVKMHQLARIHGHPGARKILEFQNSCAKNWIPGAREQHFLSHLGKYQEIPRKSHELPRLHRVFDRENTGKRFFSATLVATQGLNILNPGLLVLCCCLIMIKNSNNPKHTSASLLFLILKCLF